MPNPPNARGVVIKPLGPNSPHMIEVCDCDNPSSSVMITNNHGWGHNVARIKNRHDHDESELTLFLARRTSPIIGNEPRYEFLLYSHCFQDPSYEFVYAYTRAVLNICQEHCPRHIIRLDHITQACAWSRYVPLQDGTIRAFADYVTAEQRSLPKVVIDHGWNEIDWASVIPRSAKLVSPRVSFELDQDASRAITENAQRQDADIWSSDKFELIKVFHFKKKNHS